MIQRKVHKMKKDPKAYFFLKSAQINQNINAFLCTIFTRFMGMMKGIKIGNHLYCKGTPYLMRSPLSVITIGHHCSINSNFKSNNIGILTRSRITTNAHNAAIHIGDRVGMSGCTISAFNRINIDNDVMIGGGVLITDSDWHPLDPQIRHKHEFAKTAPVHIEKNVFIGTRSIILKGTHIGENTIIGAGSVVCGDIPSNVIAAGNPCKIIKNLDYNAHQCSNCKQK